MAMDATGRLDFFMGERYCPSCGWMFVSCETTSMGKFLHLQEGIKIIKAHVWEIQWVFKSFPLPPCQKVEISKCATVPPFLLR
jgi:hypothetical protein